MAFSGKEHVSGRHRFCRSHEHSCEHSYEPVDLSGNARSVAAAQPNSNKGNRVIWVELLRNESHGVAVAVTPAARTDALNAQQPYEGCVCTASACMRCFAASKAACPAPEALICTFAQAFRTSVGTCYPASSRSRHTILACSKLLNWAAFRTATAVF